SRRLSSRLHTYERTRLPVLSFFLMTRPPPRSTLFPYNDALPISETPDVERPEGEDDPALLEPVLEALRTVHRFEQCRVVLALGRSEEHTSELQSRRDLVCRLLLEKKKKKKYIKS